MTLDQQKRSFMSIVRLLVFATSVWISMPSMANSGAPYLFSEDGGEHPSTPCSVAARVPKHLAKLEKFLEEPAYIGSIQIEFADANEASINAWKHFFKTGSACKKAQSRKPPTSGN